MVNEECLAANRLLTLCLSVNVGLKCFGVGWEFEADILEDSYKP